MKQKVVKMNRGIIRIIKKGLTLFLLVSLILVPMETKAEMSTVAEVAKEIVYQDDMYTIEIKTIIEQEAYSTYATNTKTVSKVYEIKNVFGNTVASYTLKGKFSYNGTTATCLSATYSTTTESALWSFESATASVSGAKALGSFTAKTFAQTVTQSLTITCSKTGEIT